MRPVHVLTLAATLLATNDASGSCTPVRFGYVNQHRPPYFLGSGSANAPRPGATVDLVRDMASSAGCQVVPIRLPPLRLRQALDKGTIDAMLMEPGDGDISQFALPLAKNGKPDGERALRMHTVVFVRADHKAFADADPQLYFASHKLGINNGASLAAQLRVAGFSVDDGAQDAARNLEKLARGRIDGYAATLVAPASLDDRIAASFGKRIVRRDTPLRTNNFWLAFTKTYYERNRGEVDAMWNWVGARGHERFVERVKEYEKTP